MPHFTAGDHKTITFTRAADGTVVDLKPSGGVFTSDDPEAIDALRSFGLNERTDAQASAQKSTGKRAAKRGAKAPTRVVDTGTGETDTRGPGAPADEPGVVNVEE